MPQYRVKKAFTDAEGTHEVGSSIERDYDTDDQQYDLDAMVRHGMIEEVPADLTLTVEEALTKSKKLRRRKPQG